LPGQASQDPAGNTKKNQRKHSRRAYPKRVIALQDEAAQVVRARDLSLGGMSVDPDPLLSPGRHISIALHGSGLAEPLVVQARVLRHDAVRGVALRFVELNSSTKEGLAKLLEDLPILKENLPILE